VVLTETVFVADDEITDDDDYFEEADMFSRLEEMREKLEMELGCETFLKAYKSVQVSDTVFNLSHSLLNYILFSRLNLPA
jgi:hypothetical protein